VPSACAQPTPGCADCPPHQELAGVELALLAELEPVGLRVTAGPDSPESCPQEQP